ncbi:MAG: SDR family NAD(P)-dependent oxidoreductase [Microbacterium sp.]
MTEQVSFEGRSVLVTGGGRGLGRAFALELARRGAAVVVNDAGVATDGSGSSNTPADEVVAEITAAGGRAVAAVERIGTPEAADALVEKTVREFGAIDAVISAAGILTDGDFDAVTPADFDRVVQTNFTGSFWVAQSAYRAMKASGGGRIVLVSSNTGIFGTKLQSAYAASKSALLGLVRAIALEGEPHGVLANGILPVAVTRLAGVRTTPAPELATALQAVGHRLTPENVAPLGVYLASERCTTSGDLYSAIGGRYARVLVGVTDGWLNPDDVTDVDDLAANWDEVRSLDAFSRPQTGHEELTDVAARLQPAR